MEEIYTKIQIVSLTKRAAVRLGEEAENASTMVDSVAVTRTRCLWKSLFLLEDILLEKAKALCGPAGIQTYLEVCEDRSVM